MNMFLFWVRALPFDVLGSRDGAGPMHERLGLPLLGEGPGRLCWVATWRWLLLSGGIAVQSHEARAKVASSMRSMFFIVGKSSASTSWQSEVEVTVGVLRDALVLAGCMPQAKSAASAFTVPPQSSQAPFP